MMRSKFRQGLALGVAPIALTASPVHAGTLISSLTKALSPTLGTVTTTTATATGAVATTAANAPLPTPVQTIVSQTTSVLGATTSSTPGEVVNTLNAGGVIIDNTANSGPDYLLKSAVFVAPQETDIEPKWGKIRGFWGKIRGFGGEEVSPFWGKIRGFWGDVGPYEGNTAAFWGSLQTYNAADPRSATPQWGKIRGFWDDTGTAWANLRPIWDAGNYADAASQLKTIVNNSATLWGAAVQERTHSDFYAGFANALLARYGIDLNNPQSLGRLDVNEREHFFLEWYDGLMQFSGADAADYWMGMVNWSPTLTQTMGGGKDTIIGLLDFTVSDKLAAHVDSKGGASKTDNGHGDAVVSLIAAPHDGKGVMGFAPQAKVVAYNPFDATETAGWADIKNGILTLGNQKASVINMSLGVSGSTLHQDWNAVLADPAVALATKNTIFVLAAGNDGITQTQDIKWTNGAAFIVVGSVDPAAEISEFSNRPGETCLVSSTGCDKLKNHYIVAPGEMMLVSDGNGGVTRYSGTSFAAPLVSGTIALIHDRWRWLAQYPAETASIVLKTARDLGPPGIDGVYGVGMLDVTAALSPIDYNKLVWYGMGDNARAKPMSSAAMRSTFASEQGAWEAAGMYFVAFETIGSSYRDFAIPLSTKMLNAKMVRAGTADEQIQAYLYNQAIGWMKTGASLADRPSLNYSATSARVPNRYGLDIALSMAPRTVPAAGRTRGISPFQSSLRVADQDHRFALKFGEGDGAVELGGNAAFTHAVDFDASHGGVNPLLGMASGGAFGQFTYNFGGKVSVSAGFSQQTTRYDFSAMGMAQAASMLGVDDYRSAATTVSLAYHPTSAIELTAAYTRLHERDAILGMQAISPDLMNGGATSDGITAAASYQASPTLQIAASATLGRTRSGQDAAIAANGFRASSFQVTIMKEQLFGKDDALRISLAQPLHVDGGSLNISGLEVIDRDTGELGEVTRSFALPGSKRPLVGELQYGRTLMDGQADIALFGRAQLRGEQPADQAARVMAGARLRIRY